MNERIKECYEGHKVISIYIDKENTDKFFTGYIGAYNDTEVLIKHISRHGLYDGYIIIRKDDIYQQDCDGIYQNKIETLYHAKDQTHENIEIHDDKVLQSALEFARKKGYAINVELQDTSISGFVKEYDENTVCLDVIKEYDCASDGISEIRLEEINVFYIDSEDEQAILLLLKQNEQK